MADNKGIGSSKDTMNEAVRIFNSNEGKVISPNRPDSVSGYRNSGYNSNPVTK